MINSKIILLALLVLILFLLLLNNKSEKFQNQLNVSGNPLQICSLDPLTGYKRNGFCEMIDQDYGTHTVCATVTTEFLNQQQQLGNNLIDPSPQNNFPGLKPGDKWCLCALRWKQGKDAGIAPKVDLGATHLKTLDVTGMPLDDLKPYSA